MSQCKREGCDKPAKGRGLYCSGACRTKVSRASCKSVSRKPLPSVTRDTVSPENVTVPKSVTQPRDLLSMPYSVLRSRINSYEGDSWVGSPEFAEVKRRLNSWTLTELKDSGQPVPAWRAQKGEAA